MILNGLLATGNDRISQCALVVNHDQQVLHSKVASSFSHFAEVFLVPGLVLEELIDVLDGLNTKMVCDVGKVKVVELFCKQGAVH
jgi:hypothetical protein